MSHISTVKTKVRDEAVFRAACTHLGLEHGKGETRGYLGRRLEGLWVKPTGWGYPVVFSADGTMTFDNYSENPPVVENIRDVKSGNWGDVNALKEVLREYARQSVLKSAQEQGLFLSSEQHVGEEIVLELAAY